MNSQNRLGNAVDPEGKWLYRVGGISALVFGLAYIAIIALFVPIGAPPRGAEAWLTSMAGNTTTWGAIIDLSVVTDFLLVPISVSLYLALKGINRNAMLIATAFVGLFVFLDLSITWTNYAALFALSGSYAAVANDAQRVVFVTAAQVPSTIIESNLIFVYNTLTLSIGILIIGFVMRRGIFNKSAAYLGIVTGILGIVAVAGSYFGSTVIVTILASTLTMVWVMVVGYKLIRLSQQ